MSGPKVVNIEALRRRQKRETAACLRAVEILFADCLRLCQEDEKNHAALEKSILETITRSTALGEANLWGEAVEELRTKQDFLTAEQIHLRERAAARNAERLRIAYRREGMLAQTKVMLLSFPDTEHAALFEKFETSKNDPTAIETLIQQISANSVFREASANSQILRNLIAEFQPATVVAKINSAPDPDQSRLDRCWEILGECETFTTYDPALLDSWKRKAADVSAVPPDQRSLRLDSLVLELSAHLRDERERCALLADLEILATEFQTVVHQQMARHLGQQCLAYRLPRDAAL